MKKIGIDAISYYVPKLFLPIEKLAEARNIEYAKLNKGLGLEAMSFPDSDEDAATFGANALLQLIEENNLDPTTIGRVYLGTESALDGAKPTATYIVGMVEKNLETKFGSRCFKNCDVVDMTFACVGAVDAMHNSIDWVQVGKDRKAIVIASDLAKYDLASAGEYTQGAGAVAILISENPSVLSFSDTWGIGCESVGDFYKPRRKFSKTETLIVTAKLLGKELNKEEATAILEKESENFWTNTNPNFELFKEEPVFDGQYSNTCYQNRISEALEHFKSQKNITILEDWDHLVFHLPYAFQGRRMSTENWISWLQESKTIENLYAEIGKPTADDYSNWLKLASKSKMYQTFIKEKIAAGEKASSKIGNMYTGSIFMSLLSLLNDAFLNNTELENQKIGFFSYGSGSKSKVFEGTVATTWKEKIKNSQLFEYLNNRTEIDFATYEALHKKNQTSPKLANKANTFVFLEEDAKKFGYKLYTRK